MHTFIPSRHHYSYTGMGAFEEGEIPVARSVPGGMLMMPRFGPLPPRFGPPPFRRPPPPFLRRPPGLPPGPFPRGGFQPAPGPGEMSGPADALGAFLDGLLDGYGGAVHDALSTERKARHLMHEANKLRRKKDYKAAAVKDAQAAKLLAEAAAIRKGHPGKFRLHRALTAPLKAPLSPYFLIRKAHRKHKAKLVMETAAAGKRFGLSPHKRVFTPSGRAVPAPHRKPIVGVLPGPLHRRPRVAGPTQPIPDSPVPPVARLPMPPSPGEPTLDDKLDAKATVEAARQGADVAPGTGEPWYTKKWIWIVAAALGGVAFLRRRGGGGGGGARVKGTPRPWGEGQSRGARRRRARFVARASGGGPTVTTVRTNRKRKHRARR